MSTAGALWPCESSSPAADSPAAAWPPWRRCGREAEAGAIATAALASGEVHLWRAYRPAVLERLRLESLDTGERERAWRLKIPARREAFTFAHALLREILSAYLRVDPAQLSFGVDPEGKPYLRGRQLRFSLSHAGDAALLAVARGREVGVDLEACGRKLEVELLAAACLGEAERHSFAALDPAQRKRALLRLWTRKEALLKAEGSGLSRDPRELSLPSAFEPSSLDLVSDSGRLWTLADLPLGDDWRASVAIEGEAGVTSGFCLGW